MKNWQISCIQKNRKLFWLFLGLMTVIVIGASLGMGVVEISPRHLLMSLIGKDSTSVTARIILYTRLPRTVASLMAGVLLVLGLAEHTGASRMTVVLAGVAVSQLFSAGIDAVVTLVPDALNGVADFRIGGFSGVIMKQLGPAAALILISLVLVFSMVHQLEILGLGNDTAESLGIEVRKVRFLLLVLAAALAGAAVSFSGLISFVGLIVPHIMRRFIGEESPSLLLASALGGACFVTLCDLLARVLFAPYELPVGIVLAFTGAPFFLWLLFQQKGGRV